MIVHSKLEQGSNEWFEMRKGKVTGSILKNMVHSEKMTLKIAKGKEKNPVCYDNLASIAKKEIMKIIAQRYIVYDENDTVEFPRIRDDIANRGHAGEAIAKNLYAQHNLELVKEVGFLESECKNYGYSPDGLVGNDGFIEVKTINSGKHLSARLTGIESFLIEEDYMPQIMLGFLMNENFKWCDYILYTDSFIDEKDRFSCFRIFRNEEVLAVLRNSINHIIDIIKENEVLLGLKNKI